MIHPVKMVFEVLLLCWSGGASQPVNRYCSAALTATPHRATLRDWLALHDIFANPAIWYGLK
jgi:hypothetical protein